MKFFKSIVGKMALLTGFFLLMLAIIVIDSRMGIGKLDQQLDTYVSEDIPKTEALAAMNAANHFVAQRLFQALESTGKRRHDYSEDAAKGMGEFEENLAKADTFPSNDVRDKELLAAVRSSYDQAKEGVVHAITALEHGAPAGDAKLRDLLFNEVTRFQETIDSTLDKLEEKQIKDMSSEGKLAIQDGQYERSRNLLVGCVAGLLALVFAFFVSRAMNRAVSESIDQVAEILRKNSLQIGSAARQVSASSEGLSQSSTEQASSVQQTASAVEELNSIVNRTAENARSSSALAAQGKQATEQGQRTVQQMMNTMNSIDESNQAIIAQMNESNLRIAEIVKVISEIGDKTKVINDIVFQTKLLSFNASVEAARAGEHGKGFAVVAEEVGKLAAMSGNAAKEIGSLLEGSIQKVDAIVGETKSKVEKSASVAKSRVDEGNKMARACGEVFEEIVKTVGSSSQMSDEMVNACGEQVQGLGEISKAISQLDQVAQDNSRLSHETSQSASLLTRQANELEEVIGSLHQVLKGSASTARAPGAATPGKAAAVKQATSRVANLGAALKRPTPATLAPSNVIPLRTAKQKGPAPLKKAVGELSVPAENDPRFEDV